MKAEAYSAITIINAFATGKGGAIGINLKTEADVKIKKHTSLEGKIVIRGKEFKDFSLVEAVRDVISQRFGIELGLDFHINSEIPVGKGLKSSSALSNALAKAIVKELGIDITELDIVKLGIDASKKAGVTLTGAFDDACASFFGGLFLTDNRANKILNKENIKEMPVVLLIPEKNVLTSSLRKQDFKILAPYIENAFDLASKGEWERASFLNGLIYSSYLDYSVRPLFDALKENAIPGLCGKGPAMFAVTEKPKEIKKVWERYGKVIITSLR
jgi:shikimate kinase